MQHIKLVTKIKSSSLARVAKVLSVKLKRKVFRGPTKVLGRNNILYGARINKLQQYQWFKEHKIPSPAFTTSQKEAQDWSKKQTIFARMLLNSQEGKGIVVVDPGNQVPKAPVYTLYIPKKKEFRVHVFKDTVVTVCEKRKKHGAIGDFKIRNTANGFVFCKTDVVEPPGLRELALAAAKVTPSHFKGVDIGYNEKNKHLFVIEVNSAPGIEGSNVTEYVNTILKNEGFI